MSIQVFKGAKGGQSSGSGSSFVQTADNLRSEDTFEGLMGVCIGPIKGPTKGLKSVKLDGTAVQSENGESNFPGFITIMSDGNPANHPEKPILRLGAGAAPTPVNLALTNPPNGTSQWVTKTVNNIAPDYIDLRFIANQLFTQNKQGVYNGTASIEIEMKPTGSATWVNPMAYAAGVPAGTQMQTSIVGLVAQVYFNDSYNQNAQTGYAAQRAFQITGKTGSPSVHELRMWVPSTGAYANRTWDIRCRLVEKDSVDADPIFEKRNINWESAAAVYQDEIGEEEDWRGVSWLQIYGKASNQLSGVPDVEVETDAKIVSVPPTSIFNPETRVYNAGIWDGSWAKGWTNDPAWVINDIISDELSGISLLAPGSYLNKWDALEASKWFSEMVPDGKGGVHPRYSLNVVANQQMKAEEFVRYMAGAVGGFAWDEGDGQWRMKVDKPDNPVDLFTLDNIEGDFVYSHSDVDSRFNDYTGTFLNAEMDYQEDTVHLYDNNSIALIGHKPSSIALVGCTNRQEAMRRLMIRLRSSVNETRLVSFTTNRRGRNIEQLSTILVADGHLGDQAKRTTGRTITVAADRMSIIVRDPLRLELNIPYKLKFAYMNPLYNPASTTQPTNSDWTKPTIVAERNVTNNFAQRGSVTTIYLDAALPAGLPDNLAIALEAATLVTLPLLYRVTNVEYSDDGERVTISALEVDTGKWAASDGVSNVNTVYQTLRGNVPTPLLPPDNTLLRVMVTEAVQGQNVSLTANWQRPSGAQVSGFRVTYSVNGGVEQVLTEKTTLTSADLVNPPDGTYIFNVYTINRSGARSAPLVGTAVVDANTITAAQVFYSGGQQTLEDLRPATPGATRNNPRGAWASNTDYFVGDIFSHQGVSYMVTADHRSTGTVPTFEKIVLFVDRGAPGLNTATVYLYQRKATTPDLPTTAATYTFSSGVLTGHNNGWVRTIPTTNGLPLWVTVASASNDTNSDIIQPNEWAGATILAQDGPPGTGSEGPAGLNVATVFLYRRSPVTTVPTKPTTNLTFTFATGLLSGDLQGWQQTVPTNDGNLLYVTTVTASSADPTDVIPGAEWAAPTVMAQNGAGGSQGLNNAIVYIYQRATNAPTLPTLGVTYTFSSGVVANLNNGWQATIPNDNGLPLWVAVATASNVNTTDTIAATEWTAPQILVASASGSQGPSGISVATVFLYKRAASIPTKPTLNTTLTFQTGVLSGDLQGWTQAVPTVNAANDPLYVTTATAAAAAATDTIAPTEWATPTVMASNGLNGSVIKLTADQQAFLFLDNVAVNPNQLITLTATPQNASETITWTVSPNVTLNGTGNTRTLSLANFGGNLQVTVTAKGNLTNITDTFTIIRTDRSTAAAGADVTSLNTALGDGNRVRFSLMEGGTNGWAPLLAVANNVYFDKQVIDGRAFIVGTTRFGAAGTETASIGTKLAVAPIPVRPFERLSVSAYIGIDAQGQNRAWNFVIWWVDANGNGITNTSIASGTGGTPLLYKPAAFVNVPANAYYAWLEVYAGAGGGPAGDMITYIGEPMVTTAGSSQTVHPNFTPGPGNEMGADVTANSQVTSEYTVTTVTLNANSSGVLDAGQFPVTLALPKVLKGGQLVTTSGDTTYAISGQTPALSGISVDNGAGSPSKGQVTLPNTVTGSGSFTLNIYYKGTLVSAHPVAVAKQNAVYVPPPVTPPPTGGTGSGAAVYMPTNVTAVAGTPAVTAAAPVYVGSGKTLVCNLSAQYSCFGITRSTRLVAKFQYSPAGANSWTDIGPYATGSVTSTDQEGNLNDYGELTMVQSVAPAAGNYDVRLNFYKALTANALRLEPNSDGYANGNG